MSVFGKSLSQRILHIYSCGFFGAQLQAENSLQESSEFPIPLLPLMKISCLRIYGCPAVPHGGKMTCSEYCRWFSSLPEEAAHKRHPVGISAGALIQKILEHILLIYTSYHFHLFQARGRS